MKKTSNKAHILSEENVLRSVSESIPVFREDEVGPLDGRDRFYTDIVQSYVEFYHKKSSDNLGLRKWFFRYSFILLFSLIVGLILVITLLCVFCHDIVAVIIGIVSSFAGTVTSVLVLPKIIGMYLFPQNEDKYICKLLYRMRTADEYRRQNTKKGDNEDEN